MGNNKGFDYENTAKGFTNMLKNWSDLISERNKLKIDQMDNDRKMKSNFMWKVIEGKAERQNKLQYLKEAQAQLGQGNQENGDIGMNTPQIRTSASGEPELYRESPREQEAKINLGRKYIKTKQLRYEQTGDERFKPTERDMAFLEKYPEDIWGKEEKETPESKQFEESIRVKLSKGENLTPEQVNYYNKFMWRTGQEMKVPKKDKFGYTVGQEYKGYKYIGNNQWQK